MSFKNYILSIFAAGAVGCSTKTEVLVNNYANTGYDADVVCYRAGMAVSFRFGRLKEGEFVYFEDVGDGKISGISLVNLSSNSPMRSLVSIRFLDDLVKDLRSKCPKGKQE